MKKIITTFCAIALTAVVAQAQDADARSAAKTNEVKKEAAATNVDNSDAQKANTTVDRASYEAYKQEQLKAREVKGSSSVKKAGNNSGEVKRITNSEERKQKSSATKKRKLTPEQQKAREEKIKRDN